MTTLAVTQAAWAASVEGKQGLMALGAEAPVFSLPNVMNGQAVSLDGFKGKKALLVMVLCRHCPYVQHVKQGVAELARDYAAKDIGIVAISANDPAAYPDDRPESLKEMAREAGFTFPFLFDETQETARALTAVATPDFFLFNQDRKLVYRGQLDDSRPDNGKPVTGKDLRAAIDAVFEDKPVPTPIRPSFGCSIKWKPGRERGST